MKLFQTLFFFKSTQGLSVKENRCFSCSETRDQTGATLAGANCFEPQPESLVTCSGFCLDEMSFDWAINGIQIVKIERSCAGASGQEASCTSGEASGRVQNPFLTEKFEIQRFRTLAVGGKYRDCKKYCEGDACNDDLSVGMIGQSQPSELPSCLVCANVNDGKKGGQGCQNAENVETQKCPSYLTEGCFTAFSSMSINDNSLVGKSAIQKEEYHRGCSAFALDSGFEAISRDWYNGQFAKARREFCDEASCNDKFIDTNL